MMEPDTRLVEDIQHARQSAPDLRRQPNPLGLSARQRICRPRQREVVEPHVPKKADAVFDFLDDGVGDPVFGFRQNEIIHKIVEIVHRHFAQIPNIFPADIDGQRFLFQALSAAGGAGRRAHISFDIVFHAVRGSLGIAALQIDDKAFPRRFITPAERTGMIVQIDLFPAVAVHQHIVNPRGQVFDGHVHGEAVMLRQGGEIHLRLRGGVEIPARNANRALAERLGLIGADEVGIYRLAEAEPETFGACAVGRIE